MGPPDQQGPQYIDTKRKTMKNLKKHEAKQRKIKNTLKNNKRQQKSEKRKTIEIYEKL